MLFKYYIGSSFYANFKGAAMLPIIPWPLPTHEELEAINAVKVKHLNFKRVEADGTAWFKKHCGAKMIRVKVFLWGQCSDLSVTAAAEVPAPDEYVCPKCLQIDSGK